MVYFDGLNYQGNGRGKANRRTQRRNTNTDGREFKVVGNCKSVKFVDD